MIIKANSPEGAKTKVYHADGTEVTLHITEFDTETGVIKYLTLDENNLIVMTPWTPNHASGKMVRKPIITTLLSPGAYAEIDGVRVK